MSSKLDTEVLIVGAGPIGLILACALAHHGVPFRIIEKKEGPSTDSKAHNLIARSQELLKSIGLLEAIKLQSYPVSEWQILLNQKPITQLSFENSPTNYRDWLFSSQGVFEASFNDHLAARGVKVERGLSFEGLVDDGASVAAKICNETGDENSTSHCQTLRSRFLVGADGVKGNVRKAIGLDFEFTEMKGKATRQIDAKLQWRRPMEFKKVWFFLYEGGFAGMLPVWKDRYRIFFLENSREMPARSPTLEEMQSHARKVTGDNTLTLSEPTWFSYGTFKHGVSKKYGKGQVFLAGDAGHDALPIGGQGMNTGVHDAIGLAWRLAMVSSLGGCKAILESYSDERQAIHAAKNKQQVSGFYKLAYRKTFSDLVLKLIAKFAPGLTSRIFGAADLQQLDVAYPDSLLSEDHLASGSLFPRSRIIAGSRVPDSSVISKSGERTTIHEILHTKAQFGWEWLLLNFDGGIERMESSERMKELLEKFPWIKAVCIRANPGAREADKSIVFDLDGETHRAFQLENKPAMVFIRPDGHIAFRAQRDNHRALKSYLEKIIAP